MLSWLVSPIAKWILGSLLVLGILFGVYLKVRSYILTKEALKDSKEVIRRIDNANDKVNDYEKTRRKVDNSRDVSPINDARDSCLLSSDNPQEECNQYL